MYTFLVFLIIIRVVFGECNSDNCDGICISDACDCSDQAAPAIAKLCPDGSYVGYSVCSRNEDGLCRLAMGICPQDKTCETDSDCASSEFCPANVDINHQRKCQAFRLEGEKCGGFLPSPPRCDPSLRCDLSGTLAPDEPGVCVNDNQICRQYATEGQTCNPTLSPRFAIVCKPPLTCERQSDLAGASGVCRNRDNSTKGIERRKWGRWRQRRGGRGDGERYNNGAY
jgi:hypothetical protein